VAEVTVDVGAADAGEQDLDDHLVGSWDRSRGVGDDEVADAAKNERHHGQVSRQLRDRSAVFDKDLWCCYHANI
jgi:hypothetical protein